MTDKPIDLPPIDELGPKMRALKKDEHRVFAWHYANNGADATQAAVAAGWGAGIAYQTGWRLKQRSDVSAAISELTDQNLLSGRAIATKALLAMADDPNHKSHMKAVDKLLELSGELDPERKKRNDDLSDEQLVARAVSFALKFGLNMEKVLGQSISMAKLPKTIEAKAIEVDDEIAELL